MERWSVGSFNQIDWQWPREVIKPLATVLRRRFEVVNRKDHDFASLQLATLHFDGELEPRELRGKIEFKGKLFFAHAGDVIYSKIDVRNGAIGIVPESMPRVAVSAEYPVYQVDAKLATPDYIKLIFRTRVFRDRINAMISGASGRKRVQPDMLEELEAPLPPLADQRAIVERWRSAQAQIAAASVRVEKKKAAIDANFLAALGMNVPAQTTLPKCFAVWWEETEKWGVQQILQFKLRSKKESKFPEVLLSELCKIGSGGTPSRRNINYFGGSIPWVKTTEVVNAEITKTEETLTDEGLQNSSAKIYPKGSLLVAMYGQGATRGRTAKLGIDATTNQACAVLFDIKPQVETDFLWYFLMSQYDVMRALASGNNQPNLTRLPLLGLA